MALVETLGDGRWRAMARSPELSVRCAGAPRHAAAYGYHDAIYLD